MTLKKDFLSLSALEEANLVKSLTDFFEKLYPPLDSFGYSTLISRKHLFKLLLLHLFKSNSLGSIHLNLAIGKNLDVA